MAASMPRRTVMTALAVFGPMTAAPAATVGAKARSASSAAQSGDIGPYNDDVLPACVRSRFVHNINGLRMHVLEAGFDSGDPAGRHRRRARGTATRGTTRWVYASEVPVGLVGLPLERAVSASS